ncbi:iron-sulfur cluster assembly protein [Lactobacillus sp. 23-2]|uniref:iron-sulfur cluster assembly protein n=1 Tax=Lactobacillus sp. 23-2 TaxID=2981842 RepID=UPI003834DA2C
MIADKLSLANQVIEKLQEVEDPELLVDVVNLGLIYGVDITEAGRCTVTMTLTTMGCPLSDYLDQQIKAAVCQVPGITEAAVKLVWYPVWSPARLSASAKAALGISGQEQAAPAPAAAKKLDTRTPIKTLADRYPSFVDDMAAIGFDRIKQPGMLQTVGRVMNLRLGCQAMGFDLEEVKQQLQAKGYQVQD